MARPTTHYRRAAFVWDRCRKYMDEHDNGSAKRLSGVGLSSGNMLVGYLGVSLETIEAAASDARVAATVEGDRGISVAADKMASRLLGAGFSERTIRRARTWQSESDAPALAIRDAVHAEIDRHAGRVHVPRLDPGDIGRRRRAARKVSATMVEREKTTPIGLRLPKSLVARIDAYCARVSETTGLRVAQTQAIEALIKKGLDADAPATKKGKR